jgi:hypothetical protein
MTLTREQILGAIDLRASTYTTHPVPEWGGDVLIRRLSAGDAERSGLTGDQKSPELVAQVITLSLVDEDGNLLFTQEDVTALAKVDVGVAAQVFAACVKVNGLSSEALDEAVAAFTEAQRDSSSSS